MVKDPVLHRPRRIAFQFRYAFVCDDDGVKVLDITQPDHPMLVRHSAVALNDARDIYLCRTYAYVAAGREGVVILDIEKPEAPKIYLRFNDGGSINDATAVRVGMTNSSLYAYVADGRNGLRVLQLTSDQTPGFLGFSPPPQPQVIARFRTKGPAIALSKGLDRDRAVDESGNQLSVFGRRGARPFNLAEQRKLYLRSNADGSASIYTENENDAQTSEPRPGPTTQASNQAKPAPAAPRLRFPPRH
jgi:hypothetical protein